MTKCKCGCNKIIETKSYHKYYGIPSYIRGHYNKTPEGRRFMANLQHERLNILKKHGYSTLVIWQCELKNLNKVENKILKFNNE